MHVICGYNLITFWNSYSREKLRVWVWNLTEELNHLLNTYADTWTMIIIWLVYMYRFLLNAVFISLTLHDIFLFTYSISSKSFHSLSCYLESQSAVGRAERIEEFVFVFASCNSFPRPPQTNQWYTDVPLFHYVPPSSASLSIWKY